MRNLDEILDKIESEHPYKVLGNSGSYSQYNEAWCDCLDRVRQELKDVNDGWIPVDEKMPEDDGEYCTQCQIMTKYGVTEGWYHPNENVWYVLLWRHLRENGEIDFEKGDIPTLELINPEIRTDIIIAWMPLPDPYRPESLETRKELERSEGK